MKTTPNYSTLFTCLHDEPEPVGNLGRGAHYSVLRSVEWLDVVRAPLKTPQVHDFAIIWDEDHDERVLGVVESIYMAGLLSPIQFIGERKGILTVLVAAKFYFHGSGDHMAGYAEELRKIAANPPDGDSWNFDLGMFDRAPDFPHHQTDVQGIIMAEEHRVISYLRTIDSLWQLGTKNWNPVRRDNDGPPMSLPAPIVPGLPLPHVPPLPPVGPLARP